MKGNLGEVRMFAGIFVPKNWALCDGTLMAIENNSPLFSILGTTYGGDGRTTFGLPDLRGRVPIHAGNSPGLSEARVGEKKGSGEQIWDVKSHQKKLTFPNPYEGEDTDSLNTSVEVDQIANKVLKLSTMQPSLCLNFIICIEGEFPER